MGWITFKVQEVVMKMLIHHVIFTNNEAYFLFNDKYRFQNKVFVFHMLTASKFSNISMAFSISEKNALVITQILKSGIKAIKA